LLSPVFQKRAFHQKSGDIITSHFNNQNQEATMNHFIISSPFRRGLQIALILLLVAAAFGSSVAYASGLCVHPTGAGHCFTSIQAAVDAADNGDRIIIRAGRYVEQVTILGKDLSLIGRPGVLVQAPADMEDTLSLVAGVEGRPIILVADAEVTIRDLTIDGANSAENNPFLEGIVFINAGGAIQGNLVKDIGFGEPTLPIINDEPSYQGEGMLVVNFGVTPRTVTIAENRVVNYNSGGLTIFAQAIPEDPTLGSLTVHVVNNTITGLGLNNVIAQWGVFFGGYESAEMTGTLKGNRIRDQITTADYPLPGVGIATLSTSSVEISQNVIENVNIGLTAHRALGASIMRNYIAGPKRDAIGFAGLLVSGSDTQVVRNWFKKLETGVLLLIDDPEFGGSALNTALNENRFENVTVDVMTSPGAPVMAMARAAETPSQWPPYRFFYQPQK